MSMIDQATGAAIVERLGRGTRRVGLVCASAVALEALLQLPPRHRITGMQWYPETQLCQFAIEGPSMPEVVLGTRIPFIRPLLSRFAASPDGVQVTWPVAP